MMDVVPTNISVKCEIFDPDEYRLFNSPGQATYRSINRNPTNKLKAKLVTILRRIKRESG